MKKVLGLLFSLALIFGIVLALLPRTFVRQMAVRTGLEKNPYYQEGDTQWDNGGIEEYYFNNLPSKYNEIYRELYSRLSAGEDSAEVFAEVSVDDFWTAYYAVLADHPELFWIGSGAEVQSNAVSGKVVSYRIESTVLFPAVNLQPCTRTALHSSSLLMSKKTAGRFPNLPVFFKNPDPGIFCFKTKPASPDPVQSPVNGTVLIYSTYKQGL